MIAQTSARLSILHPQRRNTEVVVTSDASSKWECGAYRRNKWFQLQWPPSLEKAHITLISIVLQQQYGAACKLGEIDRMPSNASG